MIFLGGSDELAIIFPARVTCFWTGRWSAVGVASVIEPMVIVIQVSRSRCAVSKGGSTSLGVMGEDQIAFAVIREARFAPSLRRFEGQPPDVSMTGYL